MTLRERYKNLNNPGFVRAMVVESVYNTMQLEGQPVSRHQIERLYSEVKREKAHKATSGKIMHSSLRVRKTKVSTAFAKRGLL